LRLSPESRRHFPARFGAGAARLRTGLHHRVIAHALAVFGALGTDFRAFPAHMRMVRRHSCHKISTRLANLDTVHHQANMRRRSMSPALLQAMANGFQAGLMTGLTVFNALPHFLVHLLHGDLGLRLAFETGG
jgi:hypothetical protein